MKLFNFKKASGAGTSYALAMFIFIMMAFIGQSALISADVERTSVTYIAVNALFPSVAFLAVICLNGFGDKVGLKSKVKLQKFNPAYLIFAFLLALGMLFAFGTANELFVSLLENLGLTVPEAVTPPLDDVGQYLLFVLTLAVLPALMEEIFFRGILQSELDEKRSVLSSITVAIAFAFYHCSATQFVYQFIYGFALSILAYKAKSIWPSVVAHFTNNFIILTLEFAGLTINFKSYVVIVIGVLLLALFVLGIIFYKRKGELPVKDDKTRVKSAKKTARDSQQKPENPFKFYLPYGLFGIAVCLTLIISNLLA